MKKWWSTCGEQSHRAKRRTTTRLRPFAKSSRSIRDLFLVAEAGGAVVGTVMGGYDGHRGWIYAVAVAPEHRRRGIGSALLRRIEALLKERGCLNVNLQVLASNPGAVAFYETLGFCIEERVSMGKRHYE
jgi:ribosomal protein S18 acetylase RimI-like enzyme